MTTTISRKLMNIKQMNGQSDCTLVREIFKKNKEEEKKTDLSFKI